MLHSFKLWITSNVVRPLIMAQARLLATALDRYALGNEAHDIFDARGYHLLRKHFYLPIPERADLDEKFWARRSELVGLDMGDARALDLLEEVFPPYLSEFRKLFPLREAEALPDQFHVINGNFMVVDAHVYYSLIRHFRPRRIIEIGAGYSTLMAGACVLQLRSQGEETPELIAVEPYPRPFLHEKIPGLARLIVKRVQDAGMDLFTSLGAGDILFIDSTHVLREGGDVQFEYCEILPRLASGVLVHIHDVSLPKAYPRVYFDEHHFYWNEQYLLQAFLAFNGRFEVLWPGNYLMLKYPDAMRAAFPEFTLMTEKYPQSEPSSFWMRVK